MIIQISRVRPDTLGQVSEFVHENEKYVEENFPQCKTMGEITEALRAASGNWNVLMVGQKPVALFSLHSIGYEAALGRICIDPTSALQTVISVLHSDLKNIKKTSSLVILPAEYEHQFSEAGYRKTNTSVTLARDASATQLMPILPMLNPSEKDLPGIAKLMLESYTSNKGKRFPDVKAVEAHLRNVMKGTGGMFLAEASFISGGQGNPVSACFIASSLPRVAHVVELFTHPLYRARGLATTELARGMNQLQKLGILKLTGLIPQSNDVAMRLFKKLGFGTMETVVEMVMHFT